MKSSLKDGIKEHYERQKLSADQLAGLLELQKRKPRWIGAVSALSVAVLAILAFYLPRLGEPLSELIVKEVAYNHTKGLAPEVTSHSFAVVQKGLQLLDFQLIASQQLASDLWELVGGRYCSIQGRLAAQLRVKRKDTGQIYTLYQVPMQEGWGQAELENFQREKDGMVIRLWLEKGLLLALAGP